MNAPETLHGMDLVRWVDGHRLDAMRHLRQPEPLTLTPEQAKSLALAQRVTLMGVPFTVRAAVLACLLLVATAAAGQSIPPSPYTCADVQMLEPGWACFEHFGWGLNGQGLEVSAIPVTDLDSKGGVYRTTSRYVEPQEFCGSTQLREFVLQRFDPGYSPDRLDLLRDVVSVKDKCESSAVTALAFGGRVGVLQPSGSLVVALFPKLLPSNYQSGWAIRLERVPQTISAPDNPPSAELPTSGAENDGERVGGAATIGREKRPARF